MSENHESSARARRAIGPSAQRMAQALRAGTCPRERAFDRFLPHDLRLVSGQHWTPLATALRVAEWLEAVDANTVVDVGSGAGKFCVAAALAGRCHFTGIEQRPRLVEAARQLAQKFGVEDRVRFVQKRLDQDVIPDADAYYFFNPFGENLHGPDGRIDDEVELGRARYRRDIELVEHFLERARVGTYVIKYNGFGGNMPATYEPVRVDHTRPAFLRMWQKTREQGLHGG